jgi:hypothetical protein
MVRSIFAEDLVRAGEPREAESEFEQSEKILVALGDKPSAKLYRAYAALGRARLAASENRTAEGLERLKPLEGEAEKIQNAIVDLRLLRAKADLLLRRGDRMQRRRFCVRFCSAFWARVPPRYGLATVPR